MKLQCTHFIGLAIMSLALVPFSAARGQQNDGTNDRGPEIDRIEQDRFDRDDSFRTNRRERVNERRANDDFRGVRERGLRDAGRRADDEYGRDADSGRLRRRGGQEPAALGVSVSEEDGRVRVEQVFRDSPADDAGIREDDEIVALDGQAIRSVEQLTSTIEQMDPGTDIRLRIRRDGEQRNVVANLDARRRTLDSQRGRGTRDMNRDFGRDFRRDRDRDDFDNDSPMEPDDLMVHISNLERQIREMSAEIANLRAMVGNDPQSVRFDEELNRRQRRRVNRIGTRDRDDSDLQPPSLNRESLRSSGRNDEGGAADNRADEDTRSNAFDSDSDDDERQYDAQDEGQEDERQDSADSNDDQE